MGILKTLGREARSAREGADLLQTDLADAARTSIGTISRFETGQRVQALEEVVQTYERECRLKAGTLWYRAGSLTFGWPTLF